MRKSLMLVLTLCLVALSACSLKGGEIVVVPDVDVTGGAGSSGSAGTTSVGGAAGQSGNGGFSGAAGVAGSVGSVTSSGGASGTHPVTTSSVPLSK